MALGDLNKKKPTLDGQDPNDPNAPVDTTNVGGPNLNPPSGADVPIDPPTSYAGDITNAPVYTPPAGVQNFTTWTGGAFTPENIGAVLDYASNYRGGMPNQDHNYWLDAYTSNPGRDPNLLFQQMLGKGAAGADAAKQGIYSAANGYTYTPTASDLGQTPRFLPLAPSNAPTLAALGGGGGGAAPSADTSWMNGPPPAPGWVAVPGVGWVPPDNPAAQSYQAQQATSTGAAATGAPSNSPSSIDDQMRTAIMGLLQTPQTVDAQSLQNDPTVAAYRLSSTRAADRSRAQAVESAIQGGTYGSGALETQKAGIDQQRAEGEAGFVGQVALQKMQANREQLAQGIQFAQSMGQFDKAQSLQLQLAQMDNAIRAAQVAQSGQLGNRSLDLQDLQLQQQAQQFLDSLGFNYTSLGVGANATAAQAAMGGG